MHSIGQPSESCEMVLTSRHRFGIVSASFVLHLTRAFSLFFLSFLCSRNEHNMN